MFRPGVARAVVVVVAEIPGFTGHLAGVPWARIGEHVGQRSLRVTADTYSHVLSDERELDYAELAGSP